MKDMNIFRKTMKPSNKISKFEKKDAWVMVMDFAQDNRYGL